MHRGIFFVSCWIILCDNTAESLIHSRGATPGPGGGSAKGFVKGYSYHPHYHPDLMINKVSFTQKGYIQFLRYISDVPTMREYTFCIWVRSKNLTYAHPLLSYSKHEEDRLIRVWIGPFGSSLNLEIIDIHIFTFPLQFVENHWYHICQSWSSAQAAWNLYLNGKLKANGFVPKLRDVLIPGGGDIVVGQEFTDFDKGLDDGIEGDVYGFNFVLSSTSTYPKFSFPSRRHYDLEGPGQSEPPPYPRRHSEDVPEVLGYFRNDPPSEARHPKGLLNFGVNFMSSIFNYFDPPQTPRVYQGPTSKYPNPPVQIRSRVINEIDGDFLQKSTGLRLVEMSYDCVLGKGAPLSSKEVVVSWTKTPVRVFGGAILTPVPPFCL